MPTYQSRDFFTYALPVFPLIAANAQSNASINIEQDSDFSWVKSAYFSSSENSEGLTAASRILPLATVQIQDTGSGRYLMNGPVALTNLFGTGELPFILPEDKIFAARSTIAFTVANYGTDDIANLYLTLIGIKLFL